jgi:hypothetical protein
MKALTIKQPWAWAIVHAGKDIENRSWNTRLRGTIAIHAGLGYDKEAELPRGIKVPTDREIVHGAIIGLVDIVDVVEKHRSKWFSGPFGFVLSNPRSLSNPILCPGRLSFWEVSPTVLRLIRKQIQDVM